MKFGTFLLIFIGIAVAFLIIANLWLAGQDAALAQPVYGGIGLAALLTLAAYGLANRSLQAAPGKFVSGVMGALGFKMAVAMVVLVLVALLNKTLLKPLALSFFAAYVPYTAFEVWALLRNLRAVSKTPPATPSTP